MNNELTLLLNLLVVFSLVAIWHYIGGKTGVIAWLCLATVLANIEVSACITAYGFQQTLGNTLFASTFLATDVLSELYGEKAARQAVGLSILACLTHIIISQFWLLFQGNTNDFTLNHLQALAQNTPRVVIAGFLVYILVEYLDVKLYHCIWNLTGKDNTRFMWLRNNGATIISQIINAVLFNLAAFYGVFPNSVLPEIILVNIGIYLLTSLLDTPFLYFITHCQQKK